MGGAKRYPSSVDAAMMGFARALPILHSAPSCLPEGASVPVIADTIEEALAPIGDGIMLAVPREVAGVPMEATRALIRRGVKNLHLVALPTSSLQADLLIGAGCVGMIETSAVSLGEFGPAPRFTAAFTAAEKGVPFMPLRGIIGSDILVHRPDWRVIDNPFNTDDPIVLLPALKPDVVLIHAPMADRAGNVWIGRQRELATMAHAGRRTVVTVEKLVAGNLLDDPILAAGTLPGFYLDTIAVTANGCWPLGLPDHYAADLGHLGEYARLAATPEGFARYVEQYVHARKA